MKLTWFFIVGVSILALVSTTGVIYADGNDEVGVLWRKAILDRIVLLSNLRQARAR